MSGSAGSTAARPSGTSFVVLLALASAGPQDLFGPLDFLALALRDRGVFELQPGQGVDDGGGDDDAREPLVVGGNDIPRRGRRRGPPDHVLVSVLVLVPVVALPQVGGREFPVLLGLVEPFAEALALLLLRDVEEELPYQRA